MLSLRPYFKILMKGRKSDNVLCTSIDVREVLQHMGNDCDNYLLTGTAGMLYFSFN